MTPDAHPDPYLRGIDLFNRGEYFDAHEVWEEPWQNSQGTERLFYQALIQAAVALEHYRRGNPRSARNVWRNCLAKLHALPERMAGLRIPGFIADMERALAAILSTPDAGAGVPAPAPFDPALAPIIRLSP